MELIVVLIAAFSMIPAVPTWSPGPDRPILGILDIAWMVFVAIVAVAAIVVLWPIVY